MLLRTRILSYLILFYFTDRKGDGEEVKTIKEVPGEGSALCLPRLLLMRDRALPKQNWQLLETLVLMVKTEPVLQQQIQKL